jgi:uncharacterized lipoprotein YajG
MKRKAYIVSLIIICSFFTLSGCGAQFTKINISCQIQDDLKFFTKAKNINLYIEKFSDVRTVKQKNIIGQSATGVFNKITPVLTDNDIEEITTSAIRTTFSKMGFNVVMDEKNADLLLKGRINNFWVKEVGAGSISEHSEAVVELDIVLINKIQEKNIWFDVKKGTSKSGWSADTTHKNERIMNEALNNVIISIINDEELILAINNFIGSRD